MKRHAGVTFIIALFLLVVVFVVRAAIPDSPAIEQPIAYNHNLHVDGEGLECIDCHQYVETLAAATTTVPEPSAIRFAIMAALIFLLYGRFGKRRSTGVSL
jgi:hypothetical protein